MADYKNIPVDPETHLLAKGLAKRNRRGLGAQVRIAIDHELERERQEQEAAEQLAHQNEMKPEMQS